MQQSKSVRLLVCALDLNFCSACTILLVCEGQRKLERTLESHEFCEGLLRIEVLAHTCELEDNSASVSLERVLLSPSSYHRLFVVVRNNQVIMRVRA